MKPLLTLLVVCGSLATLSCAQKTTVEQRVIELPADDPNSTLETAAQIGQPFLSNDFLTELQKQFPNLTRQQLQGAYVTWSVGTFNGKRRVFFRTGIQYSGALPEAKAVADFLDARIKKAVAEKFPNAGSK